tara:strand:- start:609 stop:1037 length:429 start_codon:yes stop_codon:yes gene_type:complete
MTIATVTTDINIGPFKIPANGQNMIMNNYAQRNKLIVELVVPEPYRSNALGTIKWLHKDVRFTKIILCSIYQLPRRKKWFDEIVKNFSKVEFHFALEGVKGKGKLFLTNCLKEVNMFKKSKTLKNDEAEWTNLYKMMRKEKN